MAIDWGNTIGGATSGAITGGSIGGPWGALIGGVTGTVGGLFGGKSKDKKQISTFDPQQKQLYDQQMQAIQGGGGPLADVYGQFNPEMMKDYYEKAYAQPAYQEFQENVVPGITGAFRGQNLQNSSYLGGALSKAGTNVQNNLNAQMAGLLYKGQESSMDRRSQAINQILNMQTHVNERQGPSVFDTLLNSLAEGSGDMLSQYLKNKNKTPQDPRQVYSTFSSTGTTSSGG